MEIKKNTVVSLAYKMYDEQNNLIDETRERDMLYLHGGYDGIFPLVEEALHGKEVGAKIDLQLSVEDAFGERDEELVLIEEAKMLPVDPKIGMMFESDDENGETLVYTITDIAGDQVILDANHPLAGLKIRFEATCTDVREASAEEIAHGHPHQSDSHEGCCCGGDCNCTEEDDDSCSPSGCGCGCGHHS